MDLVESKVYLLDQINYIGNLSAANTNNNFLDKGNFSFDVISTPGNPNYWTGLVQRYANNATELRITNSSKIAKLNTVNVHICSFSKDPGLRDIVTAFHIIDVIVVSMVFLINIFCYAKVIQTLIKHRKSTKWILENHVYKPKQIPAVADVELGLKNSLACDNSSTDIIAASNEVKCRTDKQAKPHKHESVDNLQTTCSEVKDIVIIESEQTPTNLVETKLEYHKQKLNATARSIKKGSQIIKIPGSIIGRVNVRSTEVQTTIAISVVSLALLASFVPYFIATIYIQLLCTEDNSLDSFAVLMLRSPFTNSVVNCFIYFIFSTPYRTFIKNMVCAPFIERLDRFYLGYDRS